MANDKTLRVHIPEAINRLRRKMPENRDDRMNAIIVDNRADLIKAADAEGFTRDEIRKAIRLGAFHGWTEVRMQGIDELEAEGEGHRFRSSLGSDNDTPPLECQNCGHGQEEHMDGGCIVGGGHGNVCPCKVMCYEVDVDTQTLPPIGGPRP